MITPKEFIKFAESNLGVQFIDVQTGKPALNTIEKNEAIKNCGTCRFASKGDGKLVHKDDTVCVNANSDNCTEFVRATDKCSEWQAVIKNKKDGGGNG